MVRELLKHKDKNIHLVLGGGHHKRGRLVEIINGDYIVIIDNGCNKIYVAVNDIVYFYAEGVQ